MIKLSSLLKENRSKEITREQLYTILLENCSDFVKGYLNDTCQFIYRGLNSSSEILVVEPSKYIRKSRNTYNYYTEIIDNSPRWSMFPKRSKSIVCTTSWRRATSYGTAFIVIPYNNSMFGICPSSDIWNSFSNSINAYTKLDATLPMVITEIFGIAKIITNENEIKDNIESIRKASEVIDKNKDTLSKLVYDYPSNKIIEFIHNYIKDNKTLMDALEDLLNPKFNGFKVIKHTEISGDMEQSKNGREVWTDSNCVLVKSSIFQFVDFDGIMEKL